MIYKVGRWMRRTIEILLDNLTSDRDGSGVGQGKERVDVRYGRGDDDRVAVVCKVLGAPV
ncbi:MAG: hypothetical protein JOZ19_15200, partial [Rubrobacter sp.]|nr:hypothetical protein [Rubrobacter sp.]